MSQKQTGVKSEKFWPPIAVAFARPSDGAPGNGLVIAAAADGNGTKLSLMGGKDSAVHVDLPFDEILAQFHAADADGGLIQLAAARRIVRVLEIGDRMPAGDKNAGWIYAGISKTTKEPFCVAPEDSGVFKWNEAMAFAAQENARAPSQEELHQLYMARDKGWLRKTFNYSWYWSVAETCRNENLALAQRFDSEIGGWLPKDCQASLRLVRI
jgi:hypothetical protein